jgi:hypothetical protein
MAIGGRTLQFLLETGHGFPRTFRIGSLSLVRPVRQALGGVVYPSLIEEPKLRELGIMTDANLKPFGTPDDYDLFDWVGQPLAPNVTVAEVPKPGSVVGVRRDPKVPSEVLAWFTAEKNRTNQVITTYLTSPSAHVEARLAFTFDVFISYASEDGEVATEFKTALEAKELKCFMAKWSSGASEDFNETIRGALVASRLVLLLLTRESEGKPWVMMEVGAAWVLKRPLIPAYQSVDITQQPEPIRNKQGREINTIKARQALVEEIFKLSRD